MKYLKEILFMVTPFAVTGAMVYLFGAFLSASWNPEMWTRVERMFCLI